MFLIALITVLGFVIYLNKIGAKNLRRLMAFELYVDLAVDALLVLMFGASGTFEGAAVGATAGLLFNAALFILKRVRGWDELMIDTCPTCHHSHRRWVTRTGDGWWFWVPRSVRHRFSSGKNQPQSA